MAAFTSPQNSRYTRPIKATHQFHHQQQQQDLSINNRHQASTSTTNGPFQDLHNSMPSSDVPSTQNTYGTASLLNTPNVFAPPPIQNLEKRSNSLSSLNDGDINPLQQQLMICHRRSNSLSSNNEVAVDMTTPTEIHPQDTVAYSRISIEGLNQEVSLALEGKPLSFQFSHPDGHIAPVNDLSRGGVTRITVTTPINVYSSPPITPTSPHLFDDLTSNVNSLHIQRASSSVRDLQSPYLYPSSPKSSFVHKPRPPDNAEKCTSIHSEMFYHEDVLPEAPDRSKANISFDCSAFTPFHPPSMESLAIH